MTPRPRGAARASSVPTGRLARRLTVALVGGALAASALVTPGASAAPAKPVSTPGAVRGDVRELAPGTKVSTSNLPLAHRSRAKQKASERATAAGTPAVGTTRTLYALDDYRGRLYKKSFTLRAVGAHIEVWVADDTTFPAGDCRAQVAGSTTVTSAQAQSLADQFDDTMYPKESKAFSVAPDRDGSGNTVSGVDYSGDGDKIMTLVDNIRDDNYYEGVNKAPTYIAGFFSSQFTTLFDRNVMTIDAFDWQHRTGANPPDNPTDDRCTSRPARPYTYESTFAHEYQHLLENDQDPAEYTWVNEGLSMFAETLTGYSNAKATVFDRDTQPYTACYQGYGGILTKYNPNPRDCGGPENSLTLWGDQGSGNEILADYGEAWSFMVYLYDHFGIGFMSALHRDAKDQGLVGVQRALDGYASGADVYRVLHNFQVTTLVDRYVNRDSAVVSGIAQRSATSQRLNSTVNVGNPSAYAADGAPANGADYVALRASTGLYLKGRDLTSLRFSGATTLTPEPLRWTSVANPPGHDGNAALWSGNESNLDATALTQVAVPKDNPTLTFSELHLAEATYDYAYTVISTDGGKTYKALANANTVAGPLGPGLNGDADGFATQTFDLSAYAGTSVILGFRYVSDGGTNDGGWYVDDVKLGGTLLSDGTDASVFSSATQIRLSPVGGWNVRVVGLDTEQHRARVLTYSGNSFSAKADQLLGFRTYPRVVVIVSYDDPTEQYQPQALYTLTASGVVQPGGGQSADAVKVRADRF